MAYRDGDELETFEDVVAIDKRPLEKQERSVLCRFTDGRERFVSREQVPPWQDFPEDETPFTLEVTAWLAGKWAGEPPEEHVVMESVVVMRASDRAIQVRLADGKVEWCPLRGIAQGSPVYSDGDRGDLWVRPWLAKMKGWGEPAPAQRQGGGGGRPPVPKRGPRIGDDARSGYRGDAVDYESFAKENPRDGSPDPDPFNGDPDSDLPF